MTTKTEAASEVRKVLQAIKDRLAQPGGAKVNEATTRAHFLNPLLNALGYNSIDDILFEYYLPDGKTFLDYRLVVDGKPRVSVEAKALDGSLTDKDAAQAVSYASILGDEWAVVTNARQWRLYHAFAQAALSGKHILTADLLGWETDQQFDSMFEQLWLVSKESFSVSGGPSSWLTSQKLDHALRSVLTDPQSAEVKYIRKQLEQSGIVVSGDQVASWLKARLDAAALPPGKPTSPTVAPPAAAPKDLVEAPAKVPLAQADGPAYWLIPAGSQHGYSASEHLKYWLEEGFWGFGERTPGRKGVRVGDQVAFYAAKSNLVLAKATVAAEATMLVTASEWPGPEAMGESISYKLLLDGISWLNPAVKLDSALRAKLDAYAGRDPFGNWSWFVQTSRKVSAADFARLTGQ